MATRRLQRTQTNSLVGYALFIYQWFQPNSAHKPHFITIKFNHSFVTLIGQTPLLCKLWNVFKTLYITRHTSKRTVQCTHCTNWQWVAEHCVNPPLQWPHFRSTVCSLGNSMFAVGLTVPQLIHDCQQFDCKFPGESTLLLLLLIFCQPTLKWLCINCFNLRWKENKGQQKRGLCMYVGEKLLTTEPGLLWSCLSFNEFNVRSKLIFSRFQT